MNNEQRIVIGYKGLIGSAIYQLFDAHVGIDKGIETGPYSEPKNGKTRIMHICIPYGPEFENIVQEYIDRLEPMYTLIHSTVPPGTTRNIQFKTEQPIVHVPFHGHHTDGKYSPVSTVKDPFLYIMSVGCIDQKTGSIICDYVNRFGFHSELQTAETTEFAKIMSTNLILCVIKEWSRHNKLADKTKHVDWNGVVNIIKDIAIHEPYNYLNRTFQHVGTIDSEMSGKHCLTDNKGMLS